MREKGKILLWCLHTLCVAALCIRVLTSAEIEKEYEAYYSSENCPGLVVETREIQKAEDWLKEKEEDGNIRKSMKFYWCYDKNKSQKIYSKPKEKRNDGWKAGFTGYRRLTVKQAIWQPVEEVFAQKKDYEEKSKDRQEFIRIHIWSQSPAALKEEIENKEWHLEELYLKEEMPCYRHGREVEKVTLKILNLLSMMLFCSSCVGYIAYAFLRTSEKAISRKVYIKLGASRIQYKKEVLNRLGKESLSAWVAGLFVFLIFHEILMKIFRVCFSIPQYFPKAELLIKAAGLSGVLTMGTFFSAYAAVMTASKIFSAQFEKKIRRGIFFVSLLISVTVSCWTFMLNQSFEAMDRELSERKRYDAIVFFDTFLSDEKAKETADCPGIKKAEPISFLPVEIKGKNEVQTVAVGVRQDTTLWQVRDITKRKRMPKEEGVLLTETTAGKAGIEKGERFTFHAVYGDKKFSGTAEAEELILEQTSFEDVFSAEGLGYANAIFITYEGGKVPEELYRQEHVEAVLDRNMEEREYRTNTASVRYLNRILGGSSLVIVLLIMQSLSAHTACMLKMQLQLLSKLGCGERRKRQFMIIKLTTAFMPGILSGIIVGYMTGRKLLDALSTDSFYFRTGSLLPICAAGGVLTIVGIFAGYWRKRK